MNKKILYFFPVIILLISFVQAQNGPVDIAVTKATPRPDPPANSTVRGRVYYEDTGRPVKRASLMLTKMDSGPGEAATITDGNGEFVIRNVKAGTYYAMVNAPGVVSPIAFLDFTRLRDNESQAFEEAQANFDKIMVDGVNELTIQIPARRGGAVSGRVIYDNGDPAIGVRIEVMRKANGKYTSMLPSFSSLVGMFSGAIGSGGQTDDRGIYRFTGLPAGDYIIKVSESAKHTDNEDKTLGPGSAIISMLFGSSSFLTFYYPNTSDLKEAQPLNVVLGQELSEINLTIPDKGLFGLSGKVVAMKDKKPVAKAKVFLSKKGEEMGSLFGLIGREMNTAITDDEGNWRFKELPKGDYSVTVEPNNNNREYQEDDYDGDYPANSVKPKTPPKPKFAKSFKDTTIDDKNVEDVIIELGYGGVVSGSATTENNKEMPRSVFIQALGEKEEVLAAASLWNEKREGNANSNVSLGPVKINNDFTLENITAGKINLKFRTNDESYYVKSARSGMVDLLTTPVDIKEGQVLSGIKVVLANDVGTLKGRVIDDKDRPATGISLMLVPTDTSKRTPNFFRNVRSDTEGRFEVKLPPGEYAILFLKPGVGDSDRIAFNTWLDDAIRNAEKASINAEGTTNVSLRKAE
jgi:hypothetical protein